MRPFYLVLGFVMVALAGIGALLPLMPSTIFLILAGWFFARSSPRLERWLLDNPRFGPVLRNWRDSGAIGTRSKAAACIGMGLGFVIFWLTARPEPWLFAVVGAALAACATFVITRPSPDPSIDRSPSPAARLPVDEGRASFTSKTDPVPEMPFTSSFWWRHTAFTAFRVVALIEGVTAVGLFFVAMPMKYVLGIPEAVSIVGLFHGLAFIAYVVVMVIALIGRGWSVWDWLRTLAASIVPLGTFLNEPFLRRRQEAFRQA